MIIHGVRRALARQDWVAILIEFILVVLGVLLAFEISDWADQRSKDRVRDAAVQRLLREAELDVFAVRALDQDLTKNLRAMEGAARALGNANPDQATRQVMQAGFSGAVIAPKSYAPTTVYRELVSSGLFGELGDPKMRDVVSNYVDASAYYDQSIDYIRGIMSQAWPSGVHYHYDATSDRKVRADIDPAAVAADRETQDLFLRRLAAKVFVKHNLDDALVVAEKMCREVARVAKRPCVVPKPHDG